MNKINKAYLNNFLKYIKGRKVSERRIKDIKGRLTIFLDQIAPNKDFKKLTREEAQKLIIQLVERYKKYWSINSMIQTIRQFIKYIYIKKMPYKNFLLFILLLLYYFLEIILNILIFLYFLNIL